VDVANELFAMASSVTRAHALREAGSADAEGAAELADIFCRSTRRKVAKLFRDLWANDDVRKYKVALKVLEGKHAWLETGILTLEDRKIGNLKPESPFGKADPAPVPKARPVGAS
jgi:hypothetical protein